MRLTDLIQSRGKVRALVMAKIEITSIQNYSSLLFPCLTSRRSGWLPVVGPGIWKICVFKDWNYTWCGTVVTTAGLCLSSQDTLRAHWLCGMVGERAVTLNYFLSSLFKHKSWIYVSKISTLFNRTDEKWNPKVCQCTVCTILLRVP